MGDCAVSGEFSGGSLFEVVNLIAAGSVQRDLGSDLLECGVVGPVLGLDLLECGVVGPVLGLGLVIIGPLVSGEYREMLG